MKLFIEKRYKINDGTHERIIVQDTKGRSWEITYAEPFPTDKEKRRLRP